MDLTFKSQEAAETQLKAAKLRGAIQTTDRLERDQGNLENQTHCGRLLAMRICLGLK